MIYPADKKGGVTLQGFYDRNSKKLIGVVYTPPTWAQNSVYYLRGADDYDIVIPSVFTGYYHKVVNAGKSGVTEPTNWATTPGGRTQDGSVLWEAVSYNLLPPDITVVTSTWSAPTGVTLTNATATPRATKCLIDSIDDTVVDFVQATNHVVFSNGEVDDVTLKLRIGVR